ncbi:hypothetical protein A2U01_0085652, partial [Trifolium medium]|nr:hypothetical protein [Trifolium medium]
SVVGGGVLDDGKPGSVFGGGVLDDGKPVVSFLIRLLLFGLRT